MFNGASSFNQDISGWAVDNVRSMSSMFWGASSFNQDIGGWVVHSVTSMYEMFKWAPAFNQDISDWAVDGVTSMRAMFEGASAFNQDIGGWAVHSVNNMEKMFNGASAFNQDLGWCVDDVYMGQPWDPGAFSGTPCASTSCGVLRVNDLSDCPTPKSTTAPTTTQVPTPLTPGSESLGSDGAKASSVAFCLFVGVVAYLGVVF